MVCSFSRQPAQLASKLYIPSTINIWKKLLSTAIWADKNGVVFGRIAWISNKNQKFEKIYQSFFYSEFIQFRINFHSNNLKSERNNWWFKPWFNIILHTQSIVCATVGHLICTFISENQGLEKLRSVSNLRKISGPAHLNFFSVDLIFFSVCQLEFF